MIDPLTLKPDTQEDTHDGDRVSMDEERAQTIYARQQATQRVVGTVSGYLQSVVEAAQSSLERTGDSETMQAQRDVIETYSRMLHNHGCGNVSKSADPVKGTRIASRQLTAAEVLASPDMPQGVRETLEQRKIDLDHFLDAAIEETWVKEGRLLTQAELEAAALALKMDRPESNLDPANPRISLGSYIQNFLDTK